MSESSLIDLLSYLSSELVSVLCSEDRTACLIYHLASLCYNDSLIDITEHSELYSALFTLLHAMAASPVKEISAILLHPLPRRKGVSFVELSARMARAARDYLAL